MSAALLDYAALLESLFSKIWNQYNNFSICRMAGQSTRSRLPCTLIIYASVLFLPSSVHSVECLYSCPTPHPTASPHPTHRVLHYTWTPTGEPTLSLSPTSVPTQTHHPPTFAPFTDPYWEFDDAADDRRYGDYNYYCVVAEHGDGSGECSSWCHRGDMFLTDDDFPNYNGNSGQPMCGLLSIEGDLSLDPTFSRTTLYLPSLRTTGQNGKIVIAYNDFIESIYLPRLDHAGEFVVNGNAVLEVINIRNLTSAWAVWFDDLPSLREMVNKNFEGPGTWGPFNKGIEDNPLSTLTSIDCSNQGKFMSDRCLGGPFCDTSQGFESPRFGLPCLSCRSGYQYTQGACIKCASSFVQMITLAVVSVLFLVFLRQLYISGDSTLIQDMEAVVSSGGELENEMKSSSDGMEMPALSSIVVNNFQILAVSFFIDLHFPRVAEFPVLGLILQVISLDLNRIVSPSCLSHGFSEYDVTLQALTLTIGYFTFFFAIRIISCGCSNPLALCFKSSSRGECFPGCRRQWLNEFLCYAEGIRIERMIVSLKTYTYMVIVNIIMSNFACVKGSKSGQTVFNVALGASIGQDDDGMLCFNPVFSVFLVPFFIYVCVYIPVEFYMVSREVSSSEDSLDKERTKFIYASILHYKKSNWEVILTLRKILFSIVALPLSYLGGTAQATAFVVVGLFFLAYHFWMMPFYTRVENNLEAYNLIAATLMVFVNVVAEESSFALVITTLVVMVAILEALYALFTHFLGNEACTHVPVEPIGELGNAGTSELSAKNRALTLPKELCFRKPSSKMKLTELRGASEF